MAEEKGFNSLKIYIRKKKEISFPNVNLEGVEIQQEGEQHQIEKY